MVVQAKISTKDYVWLALYLFLLSLDQISWMLDDDRVVDIGIQNFFLFENLVFRISGAGSTWSLYTPHHQVVI